MSLVSDNRERNLAFIFLMLIVIHSIYGFFITFEAEAESLQSQPIQSIDDYAKQPSLTLNFTKTNIESEQSTTDSFIGVLWELGSRLTFSKFNSLAYVGSAISLFLTIVNSILIFFISIYALSYIHDWIPFLE